MSHTEQEITSQAASWRATIPAAIEQWKAIGQTLQPAPETHFLFVGSGTSLYIAQSAAQSFQEITGHVCHAVPSSEIFLSAASTVPRQVPVVAFVISRSGTTSEALIAAAYLAENCANVTVVGITCNAGTDFAGKAHHLLRLPHAAERSVVMTRSFTSMLLALQVIAGLTAGDDRFLAELHRLPDVLDSRLESFQTFARAVGPALEQTQFIYLGLGPYSGLAQEGTLKLKEMTQTACEAYNPLEFRHGPISIVAPGTTVILLQGQREEAYIGDLIAELKEYGATVSVLGPSAWPTAEIALELPGELSDVARSVLYLPPLQLIAFHRARAMGLDPDQPRNLNQVVVLPGIEDF